MNLGILQCDSVLAQYRGRHADYPDMIARLLAPVGAGLKFAVYDVVQGVYPAQLDECDAYIITGSKASVYDDLPWIKALEEFIRVAHRRQKPLVGICFGHQLIAQALGGKTMKASQGWGVGVHKNAVYGAKSWQIPTQNELSLLVSHQDQVAILPADAELVAGSAFCPHAMYQIGKHILAMQPHPEFTKSYAEEMMRHRVDKLGSEVFNEGLSSLARPVDTVVAAQWIIRFLQQAQHS
ncbi:MAG: gamma-glutamyl-gamma-aminobutyrate hydrolase family protein [Pseudomonadota bacterium]